MNPVQFTGQQAGSGEGTPAPAAAEKPQAQQYLTRDDLKSALSEWNREQQSLRAKQEERIAKRAAAILDAARRAEVEITPRLQQEAHNQAAQEAEDQEQGTGPAARPTPQTVQPGTVSEIEAARQELCQEFDGLEIMQGDPEAGEIDMSSPRKFLKSYEAALKKKQERAQTSPETINPRARMPMGAGGSAAGATEDDYRRAFHEARTKGAGGAELQRLKDEYRKRGVDVDHTSLYPRK